MKNNTLKKILFALAAAVLLLFAAMYSVGVFDEDLGYSVVPHGNHNHYVPHDRDPDVSLHDFPMRPPREGERITPTGEIVPIEN